MKKVKIVFWLLILVFMALVFFQNQAYFLTRNSLRIDLWIQNYFIPETPNGLFFLAFFLAGLLIAYVYYLPERFRCNKIIKQLNAKIASLEAAAATSQKAAGPAEATASAGAQALPDAAGGSGPAEDPDAAGERTAAGQDKQPHAG
jgi:hypothetical protein